MNKFINPPKVCDICQGPFGQYMYDAKTVNGPWACMCEECWLMYGYGKLGTGIGQQYKKTGKDWIKIGG